MLRVVAELGAFCSLCPFHRFQTSISVASGQISHSTASPSPTGIFRGVTQALYGRWGIPTFTVKFRIL
jgi:hypothetical protein